MRAERAERERAERDRAEERAKGVLEHALRESGRVRLLVQGQPQLEVGEPPLKRQKLDFEQLLAEHSVVSFWREFCSQATGLQYFNVPEWLYPDALSPSVFIRECCWGPTGATNVKSRAQTQVMYSVLGDDVLAEVFVWHAATLLRFYFSPPRALSQHTPLRLVCRRWRTVFDTLATEPWASLTIVVANQHCEDLRTCLQYDARCSVKQLLRAPFTSHVHTLFFQWPLTSADVASVAAHCGGVHTLTMRCGKQPDDKESLVRTYNDTLRVVDLWGQETSPALCRALATCRKLEHLEIRRTEPGTLAPLLGSLANSLRRLTVAPLYPDVCLMELIEASPAPQLRYLNTSLNSEHNLVEVLRAPCL
eukprot:TRINITY_DN2153_c0_g1_i8.p1 TRINITY_DN2153_c0_g1~~TRINITY_DN2153_c0_g1_i8.p1  ORF type:complete len:364 (-),score=70.75 TRINITY_DN2153_c0_g1_i8:492-1583(-)